MEANWPAEGDTVEAEAVDQVHSWSSNVFIQSTNTFNIQEKMIGLRHGERNGGHQPGQLHQQQPPVNPGYPGPGHSRPHTPEDEKYQPLSRGREAGPHPYR